MLLVRFTQVAIAVQLLLIAMGIAPADGWAGFALGLVCFTGGFSASLKLSAVWWLLLGAGFALSLPWWAILAGGSVVLLLRLLLLSLGDGWVASEGSFAARAEDAAVAMVTAALFVIPAALLVFSFDLLFL